MFRIQSELNNIALNDAPQVDEIVNINDIITIKFSEDMLCKNILTTNV
jgi:hypothetical protein